MEVGCLFCTPINASNIRKIPLVFQSCSFMISLLASISCLLCGGQVKQHKFTRPVSSSPWPQP